MKEERRGVGMKDTSMTATICAFSRAYHSENNQVKIFDDTVAKMLLTEQEYQMISDNMSNGILFFNKEFKGDKKEALRWVVDHQLSQTPLARAAFAEHSLKLSVMHGAEQYLICAAGFDTFAYRQPEWAKNLQIFEIDHPVSASDKQNRLLQAKISCPDNVHYISADFSQPNWKKQLMACQLYDKSKTSFCSLLGLIYYLSKEEFEQLLGEMSSILPLNSSIVFDYPNEFYFENQDKHSKLANAANETMKSSYSYREMEVLLEKYHFLIFEHLDSKEMTEQYFSNYNKANPMHQMEAQKNVNYCLCVKK